MANPFDQFDAPAKSAGNPFDQFDSGAAAPASAPATASGSASNGSLQTAKNWVLTVLSEAGKGSMGTIAGTADTLTAPVAKTRAMLAGGAALVDRLLPGKPNQTLQEFAQDEAAAAAAQSDANAMTNPVARGLAALRDGTRQKARELGEFDRAFNPELVRQQQAMGKAEGVVENLEAIRDNPMAFFGNMAKSAPAMAPTA